MSIARSRNGEASEVSRNKDYIIEELDIVEQLDKIEIPEYCHTSISSYY